MSMSGETAFCAYMVPAPRGLSVVSAEGKKEALPSLSLQADLVGKYRIYRNPRQVQSSETQTGDLSHMLSAQIWEEIGERH